jgi:hypothetical protein
MVAVAGAVAVLFAGAWVLDKGFTFLLDHL